MVIETPEPRIAPGYDPDWPNIPLTIPDSEEDDES